jgi:hypothetical protein
MTENKNSVISVTVAVNNIRGINRYYEMPNYNTINDQYLQFIGLWAIPSMDHKSFTQTRIGSNDGEILSRNSKNGARKQTMQQ